MLCSIISRTPTKSHSGKCTSLRFAKAFNPLGLLCSFYAKLCYKLLALDYNDKISRDKGVEDVHEPSPS